METDELYPVGWDYAWLAADAAGQVAMFMTAGLGPIPNAILSDRSLADRAESLIEALPERGNCQMLATLPRPDDFVAFARRGLFAPIRATGPPGLSGDRRGVGWSGCDADPQGKI
jgi:hypothetical protein